MWSSRIGLVVAVVFCAMESAGFAGELQVGPGKPFARIEEALAKAKAGDTILVYPQADHRPYTKVALFVTKAKITIKSAGEGKRVVLSGEGFDYSGRGSVPRAIIQFNKGADGCVLEGLELTGAHNGSCNGAGVRINQANDVIVRDCHIHGSDMGIMSNGNGTESAGVNQLIENCLIHSNGNTKEPGYNHNLYLGGTSVKLIGCEIHSPLTGHNVKSRAHQTIVTACYVHDSANREFDLVDAKGDTNRPGSDALIVGNIIVKSPRCPGNRGVIHFGQDGKGEHDGTLWLANNTIVTKYITPVVTLSASKAKAQLWNNIVWDGGARQGAQVLLDAAKTADPKAAIGGAANWLGGGFKGAANGELALEKTHVAEPGAALPFVASEKGDYRLAKSDPAIVDAGQKLPDELVKRLGGELQQYMAPCGHAARPVAGAPDLGAYEWK